MTGTRLRQALDWILPCLLVWGIHAVWLARDTRPPVWDMALHQNFALNYLATPGGSGLRWWELSGTYPPFVHLVIALCYSLLRPGFHVAALANVPATILLLWAVHALASDLSNRRAARWACWITALSPYMLWMSRETILDYWLSAWVAVALLFLLRSRGFESRQYSRALGVALGLGLLTKWIFAGFLFLPLAGVAFKYRVWREEARAVRLVDALLVAGAAASLWYVPNLPGLVRYFKENMRIGALEGEPPVLSWQSLIFYLRALEGYQLFAPLFLVVAVAAFYAWRRRMLNGGWFLAVSVAGGWASMTLLRTKDPRFTMPLLGLLAVPAGAWLALWGTSRLAILSRGLLMTILGLQAYVANFGVSWLPEEVVLVRGYEGALRWDWNLYLQHRYHIVGPPRREDWRHAEVLRRLDEHARTARVEPTLAIIPDLARFSAPNLLLYSRYLRMNLRVDHLQADPRGLASFDGFNYVIMVDGEQGMSWTTRNSAALTRIVVNEHDVFKLLDLYLLPNGDTARLYFVDRAGRRAG